MFNVTEFLKDRVGLASRMADLDTDKLPDDDLKSLCLDTEFCPGIHGTNTLSRCVKLGHKLSLADVLDLMHACQFADIQAFCKSVGYDLEQQLQREQPIIGFCPKDPDVLIYLRKQNIKTMNLIKLLQRGVINHCEATIKYLVASSDNPEKTGQLLTEIRTVWS